MPRLNFRSRSASACAALAALGLTASAPAFAAEPDGQNWGRFGIQTQYIDKTARPGDDFDRYVNGEWQDTFQLPADKSRIGAFSTLSDLSDERLRGILEEITSRKWPAGSPQARIAASYSAYMDTAGIEAAGLSPARPYLGRIAAAKTRG